MTRGALLARVELLADRVGEPRAHRRPLVRAVARLDRRGRVLDRQAGDPAGLLARERRPALLVEAAHVEVVDDLLDQVRDVLEELDVALHVAGDPEAAEHLLAEAVGRGDRRRVEVGERRASRARRSATCSRGQEPREPVRRRARRVRSARSALTSRSRTRSRSSPVAMRVNVTSSRFSSGYAVRDVARRQRRDRVRLAGAGARLEHGHAGRQRPADVERRGHWCVDPLGLQEPGPQPQRPAAEAGGLVRVPERADLVGARRLREQLVEAELAEHEPVLGLDVLLRERVGLPLGARRLDRVAVRAGRRRVRGRGQAGQRRRLAHPAVVEVEQDRQVVERLAGGRPARSGRSATLASTPLRPPDRDRLERAAGMRGGQREQPHPGGDPVARVHARVGDA